MRGSQSEETVVLRERSKNGMHHKTAQNPPLFYYLFKKNWIISECKNEYGVTNKLPLKESVKQDGSKVAKVFSAQADGLLSSPPWACGQCGHLSL